MAQSGFTPIITYNSGTTTTVPTAGNLANGELALNYADGKLFYKDSGGVVQVLASKSGNVNVSSFSAGTTGFTPSTATTGAVTLAGTLATTNGGTGLTSFTANGVVYASSTSALATGSALTFDGTNLFNTGSLFLGSVTTAFTSGEIYFANSKAIRWRNAANNGYLNALYVDASNNLQLGSGTSDAIISVTGLGEAMRVVSTTGNVGIGTSSPSFKLGVTGSGNNATSGAIQTVNSNAGTGTQTGLWASNGTQSAQFSLAGTGYTAYGAYAAGNAVIYNDQAITLMADNASTGVIKFATGGNAEKMRLDTSGNLGLGVTPSAWAGTGVKAFQFQNGSLAASSTFGTMLAWNAIYDGAYKYVASTTAGMYQFGGSHAWYIAPSGTAGNTISFTQAMTLDASGNLGVGLTSPATRIQAYGFGSTGQGTANTYTLMYESTSQGNGAGLWFGAMSTENTGVIGSTTGTGNIAFQTYNGGWGERARITYDGSLGVGTTDPAGYSAKLTVVGHISVTSGNKLKLWDSSNVSLVGIACPSANTMAFYTADAGTERARIDSSGNFYIGCSAVPSASISGAAWGFGGTNSYWINAVSTTGTATQYAFFNGNGSVGSISTSGSVTSYNITSDQRLKQNIQDADSASNLIDSLQVRKFDWKVDDSHQRYGFIAQELVTVAPEAVYQPEDSEAMMAVDYSKLVPMLVKEIQSLRQRLSAANL